VPDRATLDEQLTIRISGRDLARLESLGKRITIASRNSIARAALQLGISILEKEPERILQQSARGRKRGGAR